MKLIISDTHYHNWSRFATSNEEGVNSRLAIQLEKTKQAAKSLIGSKTIIHCGDMFHVRGHLTPSVLNPVIEVYKELVEDGFEIVALAGNHDLESKESQALTNAASALSAVGVQIISDITHDETNKRIYIPWTPSIDSLKSILEDFEGKRCEYEVYIHAPVNGVIMGIPDHGLDASYLQSLGYKRIFSGHYHNHVDFDGGVVSVGALTHQTFGDVDSKAGYVLYDDKANTIEHVETDAPKFVHIDGSMSTEEMMALCKGNYVKVKVSEATESEVVAMREAIEEAGALGSVIQATAKVKGATRTTASVSAGASIATSVDEWVKSKKFKHQKAVIASANEILLEAGL